MSASFLVSFLSVEKIGKIFVIGVVSNELSTYNIFPSQTKVNDSRDF